MEQRILSKQTIEHLLHDGRNWKSRELEGSGHFFDQVNFKDATAEDRDIASRK